MPPQRRNLGMVFQSYAIWPHMTVLENVAYALEGRGIGKAERKKLAMEALAMVQLAASRSGRRRGFRAASSSASPSRAPWWGARRRCCSTSR